MRCCTPTDGRRPSAGRVACHILGAVVLGVILAIVLAAVVMGLWNHLMPTLFHLPRIGFCQALGLFILGRLLFGGLHPRRPRWHGHRRPWHGCCSEEPKPAEGGE